MQNKLKDRRLMSRGSSIKADHDARDSLLFRDPVVL